jgi:Fe2+ or Zn2+ uptake regulation protein
VEERAELVYERLCATLAVEVRLTAPRRAAVRCLVAGRERQWSADELCEACNASQPGVMSRASAYRVLELLAQLGLAAAGTVAGPSEPRRYRLTPPPPDPLVLRDRASGRELRLPADRWVQRYVERLAQRHGLALDDFSLVLRGSFGAARGRRGQGSKPIIAR